MKAQGFYLKARNRNWTATQEGNKFITEHYGCFPIRQNAEQACALIRRFQVLGGNHSSSVEVVTHVPDGSRLLLWTEVLEQLGTDPRPYARLDGTRTVDVKSEELRIRTQDLKGLDIQ